jgi:hypothetical protein
MQHALQCTLFFFQLLVCHGVNRFCKRRNPTVAHMHIAIASIAADVLSLALTYHGYG